MRYTALIMLLLLCGCGVTQEDVGIDVHFCPQQDCEQIWTDLVSEGDVVCALYDIDEGMLYNALRDKRVGVYHRNLDRISAPSHWIRLERDALMHNKFCVVNDSFVITGSTNPTYNGLHKNRNDLVVIRSLSVARAYRAEFSELVSDEQRPSSLRAGNASRQVEIYFCPEDRCEQALLRQLNAAQHDVRAMVYSFTSDAVGDMLAHKHLSGIPVSVIFERTQLSKYSEYGKLATIGMDVSVYEGTGKLHHKAFIIDSKTVVTGSYNPTRNGNQYNDENMMVIHDASIAQAYLQQFEILSLESSKHQNT